MINIKKAFMRYYVPFTFECENIKQFNLTCNICQESFGDISDVIKSEADFFENVSSKYQHGSSSSIGCCFSSSRIKKPQLLSVDKELKVQFLDVGLFLNKNGIGIFWFEVSLCETLLNNVNLLIEFQNCFKELSRRKNRFNWVECSSETIEINNTTNTNGVIKNSDDIARFLDEIGFCIEGKNIEKVVLKKNKNPLLIASQLTDFHLGKWIRNVLSFLNDVRFMPERISKNDGTNLPDKAILCNCVSYYSDNSDEELDFIFHLTHGYTSSYQRNRDFVKEVYAPFYNVKWFASQEGMGQYIRLTDENKDSFFNSLVFERMKNYCYLFVLILQQYYSLLKYSKLIASLPDEGNNVSRTLYYKMTSLANELNRFFLCNTFPQVSHISHQNEVYEYLRKVFRISEFYSQVSEGLDAATERIKSYQSERHDDHIKVFAIVGAILGIADVVNNISDITSFVLGVNSFNYTWLNAVVSILSGSIAIGFTLWLIWYLFKTNRKR